MKEADDRKPVRDERGWCFFDLCGRKVAECDPPKDLEFHTVARALTLVELEKDRLTVLIWVAKKISDDAAKSML